jgi:hypothetical protein
MVCMLFLLVVMEIYPYRDVRQEQDTKTATAIGKDRVKTMLHFLKIVNGYFISQV